MDFKQCSALLYKGMHSEERKKNGYKIYGYKIILWLLILWQSHPGAPWPYGNLPTQIAWHIKHFTYAQELVLFKIGGQIYESYWLPLSPPTKKYVDVLGHRFIEKRGFSPRRMPRGFFLAIVYRIRRTKFSHETKCCLEFLRKNSHILDWLY